MALQKQPVAINFAKGVDTKTDPYQINISNFAALKNSVFTTTGRLTKRNGYASITALPDKNQSTITTLNDNLIATGSNLFAFSQDTNMWLNKGTIQPVQLDVQPMVRVSTSQQSPDTAITSQGLSCLAYMDNNVAYYQISDTTTGQQIVSRTALPATAKNPRVFLLNTYFIITYAVTILGTPTLQFIAIPIANPDVPKVPITISATLSSLDAGYDAFVSDTNMYIAWGASGTSVKVTFVDNSLTVAAPVTIPTAIADLMSVTVDAFNENVWISYWDSNTMDGYSAGFNRILGSLVAPTQIISAVDIAEITSVAANAVLTVLYQNINNYLYQDSTSNDMRSDFISSLTVVPPISGTGTGTATAPVIVLRSVGLASKAFYGSFTYTLKTNPNVQVTTQTLPNAFSINTFISAHLYVLTVYGDIDQINPLDDSNQSTYFLIDDSGSIFMRLSYSNGGGYMDSQVLPSVSLVDSQFNIPYLVADFLTTVNKGTDLPSGTPNNALYTQYGINLSKFTININAQYSSEIAGALHLTGGQLWEYDGVRPVEHGFHVWPENTVVSTATGSGDITAGTYNYVFTYEWTDNQGNLHRSAPSIPITQVTTTASSTNTINVPTLRLTYKLAPNPVRIVGYRWSATQQVYYQFTSVTTPVINDTSVDSVTITDTLSDSAILGQTLLYTTGGVIENIAAPASIASALFKNRLFLIDAEDKNLLWYSKQVIESTPVEMSDLLTLYVAPTSGAQGSTGPMTALSAMDDKLIIFKKDAIYYIVGSGPDNTGANNDFTDPVFITSSVGCANPDSIVLTPNGIMFQSDKGIWLLGRELSTTYIGAPVEAYNSNIVQSAISIPATNQVRFILDNNTTLMYDYFFNEWGTHSNISAISGALYQGLHTYLNSYGSIFQETPGLYLDGSVPVLMSLTTAWINVAGLQGYERFYFMYLLGTYYTPFTLNVQIAYDYNKGPQQSIVVQPDNYTPNWGNEPLWGSGKAWGGPGNVFETRVFPQQQKCESFQLTINENYDPSFGVPSGQGLTLSGLNLVVGVKKGYRAQKASTSFG